MKTIFISILIVSIFSSCSKETSFKNDVEISESSKSTINEIKNLPTLQSQKIAYRQLSNDEKYYLWTTHMNEFLKGTELNKEQKGIIVAFLNSLSKDIFDSKKFSNFINSEKMALLKYNARNAFSKEQLVQIFSNINSKSDNEINNFVASKCACHRGSNFCTTAISCVQSNGSCEVQSSGCGWWWEESCNGYCS